MTPEQHERLLQSPALPLPHGVRPNLNNPYSLETTLRILAIVSAVLATFLVASRVFTKIKVFRRLAVEDYLAIFSWFAFTGGLTPLALIGARNFGMHQWDMTVGQLIRYLYLFHVAVILYNIVILPLKCAIVLQCLKFFSPVGTRTSIFWICQSLLWANVVFYVIITFLLIFTCKPEAKIYDPTIQGGHCLDSALIQVTITSLNTFSDILMLVVPQKVIWTLNLHRQRRWARSCAFLVGTMALISSVTRLYYTCRLKQSKDAAFLVGRIGLWAYPEMASGFFVVCFPTLPKFFNYVLAWSPVARVTLKIRTVLSGQTPESRRSWIGIRRETHIVQQISDAEYYELVVNTENRGTIKSDRRLSMPVDRKEKEAITRTYVRDSLPG